MAGHVDILEQQESLWPTLAVSAILHGLLFGSIALIAAGAGHRLPWGDPNAFGGGSVAITPVSKIPLPGRTGAPNPLANDTQSQVPAPPKPVHNAAREPEPDAIPIRSRTSVERPTRPRETAQRYRAHPDEANQLYSSSGQALQSEMYGQRSGAGGSVGVGPRGSFGGRFGWYRDLLEQRVGQKWRLDDVDLRLLTAPPVIVTFDILRNGQIRNVRLLQGSGNRALDYSAQRAIYDAAPFPQLPAGYERDSAQIEFWFQLRR
jgi:protein TonB